MPTIITRGAVSAKAYGFGVSGGYSVGKSLRFRSSASAYLNRTLGTSTNGQKFTWSGWVKRGKLGSVQGLQHGYSASNNQGGILFNSSDILQFSDYPTSSNALLQTTAVYRDPSAWYHIVVAADTTQATAANRVLMYVNGVQITSFSTATYPTQNTVLNINKTANTGLVGQYYDGTNNYFDGYLAEVNFIDGQALPASSFGTYDTNGVWQPAKYSGTYGTNGFYLPFSNTTSTTTLVADSSGNGNNWTPNNISLTAGSTYDSMTDSPTVTSASVANYATLNPLGITASSTTGTANGNLQYASTGNSTGQQTRLGSIGLTSGKWYYEWIQSAGTSDAMGGFANSSFNLYSGNPDGDANCWGFQFNNGIPNITKKNGATATQIFAAAANNDVMMIAVDLNALKIWIGKNGTWSESGVPSTGTNAQFTNLTSGSTWYAFVRGGGGTGATTTLNVNFGQQPFTYTPPTGFNALNTYNLPTPTIANGAQYMAATTYTGSTAGGTVNNGTNNTIGTTFQPDFVWTKDRTAAEDHSLSDSVRGGSKILYSNLTNAEGSNAQNITSFNSNGFTYGTNYSSNQSYVGWMWKGGGGGGVSNTNGSITSTVSANTTAGFSIVSYTGTGANATVGHGLGVAPSMVIVKNRSASATNWATWHTGLSGANYVVYLNLTNAQATNSGQFNSTLPTSSVFSVGTSSDTNGSTNSMVAYCWAAVAGYSAFGSISGNGSTDGPFCYTGFRPRWVMFKRTDSTGSWNIWDTSRDTYNVMNDVLSPNQSAAEASPYPIDFLSNGFKLRTTNADFNASGGTYVYACFAENPFNYSRGR